MVRVPGVDRAWNSAHGSPCPPTGGAAVTPAATLGSKTLILPKSLGPSTALFGSDTANLKDVDAVVAGVALPVTGISTSWQVWPGWKVTGDMARPTAPV